MSLISRIAAISGETDPFELAAASSATSSHPAASVACAAAGGLDIPRGFSADDVAHFMQLHSAPEGEIAAGITSDLARLYGAHKVDEGARFLTFAPNARNVKLAILDEHDNIVREIEMERTYYGNWTTIAEGLPSGTRYAYNIDAEHRHPKDPAGKTFHDGYFLKADPFAIERCGHHSVACVYRVDRDTFDWGPRHADAVAAIRSRQKDPSAHTHIFQMQPGSFARDGLTKDEDLAPGHEVGDDESEFGRYLNWVELAPKVIEHCRRSGFTTVQMNGILEYPNHKSMGYQVSGFYTPSSRFGTLEQCKTFIRALHEAGIGVFLDFVPHHMAIDSSELHNYDGSSLFESDFHDEWGSFTFDLEKRCVRDFLISSAAYWVKELHIDGLRVDAAKDMHQYRPSGAAFLRELNSSVHDIDPTVLTIAEYPSAPEETTISPSETASNGTKGLGFDFIWGMGLQHVLLKEIAPREKAGRSMRRLADMIDNWSAQPRIAVFAHDECTSGNAPLIAKIRSDHRHLDIDSLPKGRAQARNILALNFLMPGPTSTFMGTEIGTGIEWKRYARIGYETFLGEEAKDWDEGKAYSFYNALSKLVSGHPTLRGSGSAADLRIAAIDDAEKTMVILRTSGGEHPVLVVQNWNPDFSPSDTSDHRVELKLPSSLQAMIRSESIQEIFNTDYESFGGRGITSLKGRGIEVLPSGNVRLSLAQMGTSILEIGAPHEDPMTPPGAAAAGAATGGGAHFARFYFKLEKEDNPSLSEGDLTDMRRKQAQLEQFKRDKNFSSLGADLQSYLEGLYYRAVGSPEGVDTRSALHGDPSLLLLIVDRFDTSAIDILIQHFQFMGTEDTSYSFGRDECIFTRDEKIQFLRALAQDGNEANFRKLLEAAGSGNHSEAQALAKILPTEFKTMCRRYYTQNHPRLSPGMACDELVFANLSFLVKNGQTIPGRPFKSFGVQILEIIAKMKPRG